MVNPSLKDQIEAAKSALENSQESMLTDQPLASPIDAETGPKATPKQNIGDSGQGGVKTVLDANITALDARISSLETKLSENQRDLHTLLGKIREITRLQNNSGKKTRFENVRQKDTNPDSQNIINSKSRTIAIAVAVLAGIAIGTTLFLANDIFDRLFIHFSTWTIHFVDFINNNVK